MSLYFQFCVLHFLSTIQKLNMTPTFGEEKFFGKLERVVCLYTLWVENFNKIALSHTVKEILEFNRIVLCPQLWLKTEADEIQKELMPDRQK